MRNLKREKDEVDMSRMINCLLSLEVILNKDVMIRKRPPPVSPAEAQLEMEKTPISLNAFLSISSCA